MSVDSITETSSRKGCIPLTFPTGVSLDELVLGTSLLKFGGQPSQLRQHLVNKSDFGCKIVLVKVESQMTTDKSYCRKGISGSAKTARKTEEQGKNKLPNPPTINTAGFLPSSAMTGSEIYYDYILVRIGNGQRIVGFLAPKTKKKKATQPVGIVLSARILSLEILAPPVLRGIRDYRICDRRE